MNFQKYSIKISMESKNIIICNILAEKKIYIKFGDVLECDILEDSNTIFDGGVGRAVVGGVLAGKVGAIVGANTRKSKNVINSLQVRIVTKNISNSLIIIDLIDNSDGIEKSSSEYINAMNFSNEIYATLTAIIDSNKNISEVEKDIK